MAIKPYPKNRKYTKLLPEQTLEHQVVCKTCGEKKASMEFYLQGAGRKRVRGSCKKCFAKKSRDRGRANPFSVMERHFGLTETDYYALLEKQGGCCGICRAPKNINRRFVVDHNHETKKVRGLLCDRCNKGLGLFRDNRDLLVKAGAYLEINGSYAQVREPTRYNIKEHTRTTPQRKFVRYDYGD